MKRTWLVTGLTGLTALGMGLLSGCSSSDSDEGSASKVEESLEIFSWWTSSGEAEALQSLFDVLHEKQPDLAITNAAAKNSTTARDTLKTRMEANEPPDSFQGVSGKDLMLWVDQGKMQPIDDLSEKNDWASVFPKTVLDTMTKDGKLYAVPANIERDNNLYYSIKMLADNNVEPPKTLPEFYAACETLQGKDITPLSVPAAGWVLGLVGFETLMPAVVGGEFYVDFLSGKADPSDADNEAEIRKFFTEFAKVLACSNVSTSSSDWAAGGDVMVAGDAAMYVMGDWGKGYLQGSKDHEGKTRDAWKPGEDFGVVPGLGSDGYFTFNSAVFGLPRGAQHPNAAKAFIEVVASEEGQLAFNPIKGSVPARDVPYDVFDDMVRGSAEDFKAAEKAGKLLPGYATLTKPSFQNEMNPSLLVFAVGGERAKQLDSTIPDSELSVPPLNVDYVMSKIAANYSLTQE